MFSTPLCKSVDVLAFISPISLFMSMLSLPCKSVMFLLLLPYKSVHALAMTFLQVFTCSCCHFSVSLFAHLLSTPCLSFHVLAVKNPVSLFTSVMSLLYKSVHAYCPCCLFPKSLIMLLLWLPYKSAHAFAVISFYVCLSPCGHCPESLYFLAVTFL